MLLRLLCLFAASLPACLFAASESSPLPASAAECPCEGGVIPPTAGFSERGVLIGADGQAHSVSQPDDVFAGFVRQELPTSDRAKWFFTVYVDGRDPESQLLLKDLAHNQALRALISWAKLTVIDRNASPSGEARVIAQELEGQQVPAPFICVYASPSHPVFGRDGPTGWVYAFRRGGYGGDADMLARNIYEAIRRQYVEHGLAEQCPGPYCPNEPRTPQPDRQPDREPYRPTLPQDDWRTPMPRMDEPSRSSPFALADLVRDWWWAAAIAVGLWIAWRKGLLDRADPPSKPPVAGVLLLAVILAASTAHASAVPDSPGPWPGAESPRRVAKDANEQPEGASKLEPIHDPVERFYPDRSPAGTALTREQCGGFYGVLYGLYALIQWIVWAVKAALVALAAVVLLGGLAIVVLLRRTRMILEDVLFLRRIIVQDHSGAQPDPRAKPGAVGDR